jgi:hypothetical protein
MVVAKGSDVWLGVLALCAALGLMGCSGTVDGLAGRSQGEPPPVPPGPEEPDYCDAPVPGTVVMRRLGPGEYRHTLRDLFAIGDDLFGIAITNKLEADLPDDPPSGDGFQNNGDHLEVFPAFLEQHATNVKLLVAGALGSDVVRPRIIGCDPSDACAETSIRAFAARAWRRPVTDEEHARLFAVYTEAKVPDRPFDDAMGIAMRAVMLSPNFLFRPEVTSATSRALSQYELASRLSYALWASMPDDALFARAAAGELTDREILRSEVTRMLSDPKSEGFYRGFFEQWLSVDDLADANPAEALFPDFNDALREAMAAETRAFTRAFVEEEHPLGTLLSADFTIVTAPLAAHYGAPVPDEDGRIDTTDLHRGGVLTQAAVLTVTSHADTTSPVKRGRWVLDTLLCSPPPPAPGNVNEVIGNGEAGEAETPRERLERHRQDPACAGCHQLMDPLGFAFDHYDAVGAWRDGEEIDASGELPGGVTFYGVSEMAEVIEADERFSPCVTKKLMSYMLGRTVTNYDRCYVDAVTKEAEGLGFADRIAAVVASDVFLTAGGVREEEP